ncbi:MAG TPA: type II secretion system protein GspN [Nitrospirota bacterium]|nr:type II secretion system protein GspN [Nitrospirota bacterium]
MTDKKNLIRRLSLAAYFVAAFLVFLLLLFPFDRIKANLEREVRERTALELTVSRISPRFFNSVMLTDVVLADQQGKVLFESPSIRTSVSLFSLLRGILSLDIKAKAYGGILLVKAQQGAGQKKFLLDADGLDIATYQPLKAFGLKLSGKLGGNVEMSGDVGKGRLWLKGLTSRELTIKGFPIPDLDFDQCWFEADIRGDRLTIKKLELDGKELKVQCLGDVVLRERGTLNLTIKLKPSERLAQEQSGVFSLLKNRDAEGYYQFSLGGTLAEPLPRL